MVERQILIIVVQQLEGTFSIVRTNVRNYFSILDFGAKDVSAERRNTRRRKSGDDCIHNIYSSLKKPSSS
jgi:hypothetical protein